MSNGMPRRAFPIEERGQRVVKTITADTLEDGGKKHPAGLPGGSGIKPEDEGDVVITKMYVPLAKANAEKRTVTGVVLEPETTDAHLDIYDADVIADAAYDFLANYNINTELGLMHKDFKRDFELLESYVAPIDFVLGDRKVKMGSWIMTVRINDDAVWKRVKEGKIAGFSIGGKARVKKVAA